MVLAVGTTPPASSDCVYAGRGPANEEIGIQASEGLGELINAGDREIGGGACVCLVGFRKDTQEYLICIQFVTTIKLASSTSSTHP